LVSTHIYTEVYSYKDTINRKDFTMKKLIEMFLCMAVLFFAVSTFAGPVPDVVQNQCRDNTGNPIIRPSSGQSFNGWDASFAINSNPNIRLDLNGSDLQVPHIPPEITVQHNINNQSQLNRMINDDPFSNPNNRAIQELPVLPSDPTGNVHKVANHELASSPINTSSNAGAISATISGTVYQSDGVTPLTGKSIYIYAYTGSLCGVRTWFVSAYVNSATGIYTIPGLPDGTYYLQTSSSDNYYINEWWASPLSVRDSADAQSIVVTGEQIVTDKNFQLDHGATISGTVYQSDGVTPLTGKSIYIYAYSGSPCGSRTLVGYAWINSITGIYTIPGLPDGTYYLQTSSSYYISEWWASPLSVRDCAGAQSIVVTEEQTVTDKNFQLDTAATISGTVYQSDGVTPLTGKNISVYAYTGSPCGGLTYVGYAYADSTTGIYTISRLPAGTYYLQTNSSDNYISEWWASPQSVRDCAGAQSIVVTEEQTLIDKNFQLDTGATISGTVYQSDGVTPLTGKNIYVIAYTGSPCGSHTQVGYAYVNSGTGIYTIAGLPAGTYYLQTSGYVSEWWASPQSVRDCAGAQSIVVTEGQIVTGKNFQLDGATISGTVYQSDGVTPLTCKNIYIYAYTGSPCGSRTGVGYAYINQETGTYAISGLPTGTYYLLTSSSDYTSEWWASPRSVRDCAGAQSIVVTEGQTVTDKNFQLEPGATISGTVYQSDGVTPLTGKNISVIAWTGSPCGSRQGFGYSVNPATGTYTIPGRPAGTYYLQTQSSDNYINEWWASPLSVWDCAGAQSIVVTEGQTVTDKNFQLEPGATISGTVYQSDGVTPLTGKNISVIAWTGSPCGGGQGFLYNVNPVTGTYTIPGQPAGTYYLQTNSSENYISEWWASPLSVRDCAGAQSIVVADGQTVTGKNFQLDTGATISGTVYQSDGVTPLTGKNIYIDTWTGSPCGGLTYAGSAYVNSATGIYTIPGLPTGTYYLLTYSSDNYTREWWASPLSVRDCAGAQSIVVTEGQTVTGKNFQLDDIVTLFETDGTSGIWKWDGSAWSQLTTANPENMITSGSTLYVDFGVSYGLYKWSGGVWSQLASANPENMAASSSMLYVDFGASYGLWKWDGSAWFQLTPINPENMVASGSTLYVDFGAAYGLYKWDGAAWAQLTSTDPENMVASSSALYVDFGAAYGLWKWDGSAWFQLTPINPENMVASSSTLYVDFGASYGLYKWDGAAWAQLTSAKPENMAASSSTLYVGFGASYGLYKWDGAAWAQLTSANPENMVASGSTLYVDFGALGLYKWDGSSWSQLTWVNPVIIVVSN
jgi:hypothetical protein